MGESESIIAFLVLLAAAWFVGKLAWSKKVEPIDEGIDPADCDASPFTCTKPDIMFSPTPVPALPLIVTVARLFIPAQ